MALLRRPTSPGHGASLAEKVGSDDAETLHRRQSKCNEVRRATRSIDETKENLNHEEHQEHEEKQPCDWKESRMPGRTLRNLDPNRARPILAKISNQQSFPSYTLPEILR